MEERKNMSKAAGDTDIFIHLEIRFAKEVDVYVYQGRERKAAYLNLTQKNEPVRPGRKFELPI